MITVQTFSVDEVDYEVKLVGGTSIVFKATIENPDADGTWWDDDLTYSTVDVVGGTKRPLKVYSELAEVRADHNSRQQTQVLPFFSE